jgi:serine/threonine protein kinase
VQLQPHIWLTPGRRLQGTLSGQRRVIADATWVPFGPGAISAQTERVRALAAWLATPRSRLPRPVGMVYGDGALLFVAARSGGRALADLAPLPAAAALNVVAQVLDSLGQWFADAPQLPLSPAVIDPWSLCLRHDGGLSFTHLLPGEQPLDLPTALVAVGRLLDVLRENAEDNDEDAATARALADGLTGRQGEPLSHAAAVQWLFDLNLRSGALKDLARTRALDLGPHGGEAHPWSGRVFSVQHWRLLEVPDVTGSLVSGRVVEDRFAVQSLIAQGGMGRILSAWDPELQREVALKVLYEDGVDDSAFVARFLREIRVTAQLAHPAIVPVYSLEFTEAGTPAFTMKHIEGQTFHEYLRTCVQQHREGTVDEAHALPARLEHFVKACDAVSYAHSRGILHRDLKIENLMVGPFHEVYVMDWGVARAFELPGSHTGDGETEDVSEVTQVGDIVGTETYMSPEQALGVHHELTPASDQFSLGLVLYELVTMLRARATGEPEVMLEEARIGLVGDLEDLDGNPIPPGLRAIIERATARAPHDRYPDVADFAEDVRRYLTNRELSVLPDGLVARRWRRLSRNPSHTLTSVLFLVTVAAIIAAASLVGSLLTQRRAAERGAHTASVVAAVSSSARDIDARLQQHGQLVDSMGRQLALALQRPPVGPLVAPLPADLRLGAEGVVQSERRSQLIDFGGPVQHVAPGAEPAAVQELGVALGSSVDLLRLTALSSLSPALVYAPRSSQDEALSRDDGLLMWTIAAFESGLFLSYPAHDRVAASYDPRGRPWYQGALGTQSVYWGAPHVDSAGTGLLLAASVQIRGDEGGLYGVAAVQLELDRFVEGLREVDIEHFRRAQLVDAEGRVLVDTEGPPTDPPSPIELEQVRLAVASGDLRGQWLRRNELIVYDRLNTLDWTLVVRSGLPWVLGE